MSTSRRRRNTSNSIEETFTRYDPNGPTQQTGETEQAEPLEQPGQSPETPPIVPTQIMGLDNLINGGLPNTSLLFVVGDIGSGYTTFINQILNNRLQDGGKVAYYTVEMSGLDIQGEMDAYNWTIRRFIETGQWQFIDVLTPDLQQLSELAPEGFGTLRVNLTGSLNALKSDLLNKIKEDRWTVLPISHLLHTYSLREVMDLLLYWRAAVRAYGGVHFAILPSGVHPDASVNALKHLADGVIEFKLREGPRDFEGFMVIRKLRGLRSARQVQFSLSEYGLVVETAERIR